MASDVINEVMKVWFNNQIEVVLKDSEELSRMYHEGHMALAVQSARAISREIYREDFLRPDYRELLTAAVARKREEFNVTGVEVFSSKLEMLVRMTAPEATDRTFRLPVGQLVRRASRFARRGHVGPSRPSRTADPCGGAGRLQYPSPEELMEWWWSTPMSRNRFWRRCKA